MNFRHYKKTILFESNQQIPNWEELKRKYTELGIGVDLANKINEIDPSGEVLIVGGAVRDLVQGKEPHDIDIATNIDLEKIEQHFKTNDIGKSKDFGIALVHHMGKEYEVAGYREESDYTDSRRPDTVTLVKDFKRDAARRDLTINAMGIDSNGIIYDYFGGIEDIRDKQIRTVGDAAERFKEDALRVLRAPRFAATQGFQLSDEIKAAIKSYPLNKIAQERITQELKKAATSGKSLASYIEMLDEAQLLDFTLPWIHNLKGHKHNPIHHPEADDTFGHVMECLKASKSNDPITNLAILFHDVGKGRFYQPVEGEDFSTYRGHDKGGADMIRSQVGQALKLSGKDTDAIATACELHMLMHKIKKLARKNVFKLVDNPHWELLKNVTYADEMSRAHLADEQQFYDKIQYAEELVKQHGTSQERKKKLKGLIDGNKVMTWIPELKDSDKAIYIGQIINRTSEWIVKNNFDVSEQDVEQYVKDIYNEIINVESFKNYHESVLGSCKCNCSVL